MFVFTHTYIQNVHIACSAAVYPTTNMTVWNDNTSTHYQLEATLVDSGSGEVYCYCYSDIDQYYDTSLVCSIEVTTC